MPKKSELSAEQRLRIKILHEQGMSQVKIAREVKCSRCAVQYAINRFKETGTHENRPRTGRRKVTTEREDRLLIRQSLQNRKKTALELAAALSEAKGSSVSVYTVRRRLLKAGLKGFKARKKPWLSEHNKKNRLEWALKHRDWSVEDWSNVLWSDESNFEVFGTPGVTYVRRRVGEEYNPECVVPTVKHGGGSIMIWGCMAADGVGEMVLCEGRMNSVKYTEVLETALATSITQIFGDTNTDGLKFQQDNATCHKSAHTMKWFAENHIDLLDWPPQSPDLNPIEHIWSILKKNIRRHSISNKQALLAALQQEWKNISREECFRLVESMPKRVAAVIKSKGGPTKY
ncbi:unnamed protein product [Danaus chrysippus]|uniref:(African queen) hypothetical protein n=1 Tax=Danaus chrysippus TaxID=151541 RepID=A0A8J2QSQ4_9NEOP|nr:unnamed protein product [Danaus chrysippus]